MRIVAAYFAILALGCTAVASDVQLRDHVVATYDGIGCTDWPSFEAFRDTDPRTLKGKVPAGCLVLYGSPPTLLIVDVVNDGAAAICVRPNAFPPPCFWFSTGKIRTLLPAGQRKV